MKGLMTRHSRYLGLIAALLVPAVHAQDVPAAADTGTLMPVTTQNITRSRRPMAARARANADTLLCGAIEMIDSAGMGLRPVVDGRNGVRVIFRLSRSFLYLRFPPGK